MELEILFYLCLLLHCTPIASSFSGKLLFSPGTSIMEFDIDTSNVTVLVQTGGSILFDMAYDYKNRFIFFPRYKNHDIVRLSYPSENRTLQKVVRTDQIPVGIAVDSDNDHIYWVEQDSIHKLLRCNLDGTNITTVLSTVLLHPWVIRLDVTNRWIYIVNHYSGISKSRFDSNEWQTIVNFTSTRVDCMDIDRDENRLYWINYDGDVKSAEDDGTDVKTIHSINVSRFYDAISVFGSNIYYANANQLLMVSKTPGSTPTVLYNDTNEIYSIFVFQSPETSEYQRRCV